MSVAHEHLLKDRPVLFVKQRKEWTEILVDWETRNQYQLLDDQGGEIGVIAEKAGGVGSFVRRALLRSHRGFEIAVFERTGEPVLRLERPFFFLFSDLTVSDPAGKVLGHVKRRFGLLYKRYDLQDATGRVFAQIAAPRWRLWTFPIADESQGRSATIAKKWGGGLREVFADADTFRVEFLQGDWSGAERAVILAAALSIDFDFFENNQGSGGLVDLLPGS